LVLTIDPLISTPLPKQATTPSSGSMKTSTNTSSSTLKPRLQAAPPAPEKPEAPTAVQVQQTLPPSEEYEEDPTAADTAVDEAAEQVAMNNSMRPGMYHPPRHQPTFLTLVH
jgi:hypothetical protein